MDITCQLHIARVFAYIYTSDISNKPKQVWCTCVFKDLLGQLVGLVIIHQPSYLYRVSAVSMLFLGSVDVPSLPCCTEFDAARL